MNNPELIMAGYFELKATCRGLVVSHSEVVGACWCHEGSEASEAGAFGSWVPETHHSTCGPVARSCGAIRYFVDVRLPLSFSIGWFFAVEGNKKRCGWLQFTRDI